MNPALTLDASELPTGAVDHRAPLWWGNLLMLFIESTMFAILIASYFYIRLRFPEWPPPRVDRFPILYRTAPDLAIATTNIVLLLLSCVPMFVADRGARAKNQWLVNIGISFCILLGAVAIILRFLEFPTLHFHWNETAYGSITWTILGMHLLHLFVMTLECTVLATWLFTRPLDTKHALDVRVTAVYWYWVVGIWVPLYAIVYWGPRIF